MLLSKAGLSSTLLPDPLALYTGPVSSLHLTGWSSRPPAGRDRTALPNPTAGQLCAESGAEYLGPPAAMGSVRHGQDAA